MASTVKAGNKLSQEETALLNEVRASLNKPLKNLTAQVSRPFYDLHCNLIYTLSLEAVQSLSELYAMLNAEKRSAATILQLCPPRSFARHRTIKDNLDARCALVKSQHDAALIKIKTASLIIFTLGSNREGASFFPQSLLRIVIQYL
jgi:hypothetical protein